MTIVHDYDTAQGFGYGLGSLTLDIVEYEGLVSQEILFL